MLSQTPNQAAALHRAEINLTVNLLPDKPITPNQIPSLLSSLALVHAEASLLSQLDQSPDHLDHLHVRRLDRLIRSIRPCANFLKAVTPSTHIRLSVQSARTIAAFIHLHVAHTPDLVTALAAFVSLPAERSSSYHPALITSAVELVPALHALLEQPVDPPLFHRAALPALPAVLHVATHYVQITVLQEHESAKLRAMLALAEIAVDIIAIVQRTHPAVVDTLYSHVLLLSNNVDRILSDVPEAKTLQRDLRNLLQVRTTSFAPSIPSDE